METSSRALNQSLKGQRFAPYDLLTLVCALDTVPDDFCDFWGCRKDVFSYQQWLAAYGGDRRCHGDLGHCGGEGQGKGKVKGRGRWLKVGPLRCDLVLTTSASRSLSGV